MDDNSGWPQNYNMGQIASVSRGGSLPRASIIPCPAHTPIPPPPPPPPLSIPPSRTKHVSFARAHTLTTFDDSVMPAAVAEGAPQRYRRDCTERLIDGRVVKTMEPVGYPLVMPYPHMTYYPPPAPAPVHYPSPLPHAPHTMTHAQTFPRTSQTEHPKVVVLDSIKKGVMRTQATQTEVCLGRKPLPPNYLSLSPRTIKRVKMVAAGVQTNGYTFGVRRLTKSFSEVGGERLADRDAQCEIKTSGDGQDHEKLHRTQSEEPPRSPRSPSVLASPVLKREDSEDITSSPIKSIASSQLDRSSDMSALQKQAQEYFQQNFQFIHESDRDDTIDDDIETIEKSMALNQKNLEYLQQEIAKQAKGDRSLRSILSKSTSDASQKTINSSHQFSKTSTFQSEPSTETSATTTDESEKNEKEIIIDFEPRPDDEAIPYTTFNKSSRRLLQKTLSEGEILLDVRKTKIQHDSVTEGMKDAPLIMSTSQENMVRDDKDRDARYKQYIGQNYVQTPIKDEGIFGFEPDGSFSSSDGNAPYEDFHEKYISYKHDSFSIRSVSFEEQSESDKIKLGDVPENGTAKSSPASPNAVNLDIDIEQKVKPTPISKNVTTTLAPLDKSSPCASSESLAVEPSSRDHSDGIWNESQTTVLQVDSGTENGTVISSSDLSSLAASPGALALLTPTSRRKQLLLLQHQQRSSLDTDALDEEFDASQSQSPTSPRNKLDTSSTNTNQSRASLSPPAVVPSITSIPITKQPTISKTVSPVMVSKVSHTPAIAITHPSLDLGDVPFKRTPSFINKKRERALSPSRRRDLQKKAQQKYEPNGTIPNQILESPSEASAPKVSSSETNLARTDSGKTNTTDVSESTTTTTTEDYVTANSDSSKKSNSKNQNHTPENNKAQEGSSFESASSLYSSTRTENMTEDLIVPSFSPPLQINDDFMVPNLSSPPLPLPDRIPKPTIERREIKIESVPVFEKVTRDKTENKKTKNEISKPSTFRDAISGKSSSSGSYSIGGSNPNVTDDVQEPKKKIEIKKEAPEDQAKHSKLETKSQEQKIEKVVSLLEEKEQRVPKMKGSLSDDERSVHYSSSGYYESPVEDDDDGGLTYKHSQKYRSSSRSWVADEKRRKKKTFTLEFSKSYDDSISTSQDDWSKKSKDTDTVNNRSERSMIKTANGNVQSSPRDTIDLEKVFKDKDSESKRQNDRERHVKRTKLKAKSPTQNKVFDSNGHIYRPQHFERREGSGPNMKLHLNIPTSDDSSEQYRKDGVTGNGNVSPRKHRRLRDSPRRKTGANSCLAKSPISGNCHSYRTRRKSGSNESISLPGSLPRRKQSMPTVAGLSSLEAEDIETSRTLASAGSRLTPLRYIKSPTMSPRSKSKNAEREAKFGKAASAESLRSVSPGSDSVFYSEQADPSLAAADGEAKAHCLHCGKEVHIVTAATHEHDSRASKTSHTDASESFADATPDIVPAPAGFADSPASSGKRPGSGARLYKKLDKRYRSEDKTRHHHRHRQDVRAKSEERGKEEYAANEKQQATRIARSAGNSLDKLAGSSASVDPDGDDSHCLYATD
ncbi:hypothetical protein EVAR_83118_1 [Eumeta japonica]|uniref:Uncharacterized protein n=1 Tax=Eumeta variegata TaxID=151549 RepID=A0A4C1WQ85_EUMVA|nr:hypothetical protein EVAR_83118_1 [Eumeta japonica]